MWSPREMPRKSAGAFVRGGRYGPMSHLGGWGGGVSKASFYFFLSAPFAFLLANTFPRGEEVGALVLCCTQSPYCVRYCLCRAGKAVYQQLKPCTVQYDTCVM